MPSAMGSILRAASRRPDEPLRILVSPTHERAESNLARTGHHFFAIRTPFVKDWNPAYAPLPANYHLLDASLGERQLPVEMDFDLALIQNRAGQYQLLKPLADRLHIPTVMWEHTVCGPWWTPESLAAYRRMTCDVNVFISAYSREKWGFSPEEGKVIEHGLDTEVFSPGQGERGSHLLSVVNDWVNRDAECGFRFWKEATAGMPTRVLGNTPGLSQPANGIAGLVEAYRSAHIFVNTSQVSPIPMSLMEAMACGCCPVSTATCAIPELIENGVNGVLVNTPAEMATTCRRLLADPAECRRLGDAARRTIVERYSLGRFVTEWDSLLRRAASLVYRGAC